MRFSTISLLSMFVVFPAIASGQLPVVNIASGGVSARAAFGEPLPTKNASVVKKKTPTRTTRVVTRPVHTESDVGQTIVASNDVLSPRRPSNDLWAKSDYALRMPTPNEFSVMRSDAILPEESLDTSAPTVAQVAPVAPVAPVTPNVVGAERGALDMQIARLNQLQKRADDSVRQTSKRVIAAPVTTPDVAPYESEPVRVASATPTQQDNVSLHRMVVPMDTPDVVTRAVKKSESPRIAAVRDDMTGLSPTELRKAFRKTFLSENKHLSTFAIDSRFDTISDMSASIEGFTAQKDLSESGGIRPLEIKIKFRNDDSALSRANYTLLSEYAAIVVAKPTRAIQVAIPQYMTDSIDGRKLAARRLAIIEQVLTDNGVSLQRIVPVLSNRDEPSLVLRIISSDEYEILTQRSNNMFGDTVSKKTYKSMSW